MKILNRKEFLDTEAPVLYHKYESVGNFGELCIKTSSPKDKWGNDWTYQDITESTANDSNEFIELMTNAEKGFLFRFDLNCEERDGLYDEQALFAVYDKSDIEQLIKKLQSIL